MKIAVFGASGRTGGHVVRAAVTAGHEIVAFARGPERLQASYPDLHIAAYPSDAGTLVSDLRSVDAVISTLASGSGVLTGFAQRIVPAMKAAGIGRLVSLVGAGVAMPGDPPSLGRSFMMAMMSLVASDILADASRHAELIAQSDLDWTLVRPPRLTNAPGTRRVVSAETMQLGPADSISREDLALFMLDCATSRQFVKSAPMVANR